MANNFFVGLIDFRGVIIRGDSDTLRRHELYADETNRLSSGRISLICFSSVRAVNQIPKLMQLKFVVIKNRKYRLIKYSRKVSTYISHQQNLTPSMFIAGDPWESFWAANLIRKLTRKKIPIQVQIHADISDYNWIKLTVRNRIRSWLATYAVNRAETIRLTSEIQKLNLVKRFPSSTSRIVVVPVPLNLPMEMKEIRSVRVRSIGLVGRIQVDRGLANFVEVVRKLAQEDSEFSVVIIGDGPSKYEILGKLIEILGEGRVEFHGPLSGTKLQEAWESIGVLASVAPAESYGRAIRESIYYGVPVWAVDSSGVRDAIENFPEFVKLLDPDIPSKELIQIFDQMLSIQVPPSYSRQIHQANTISAGKIVETWITE